MLWLCAHNPQLPLTALAPAAAASTPQAVLQRRGSRSNLWVVNDAALARGLQAGMTVPGALSLVPELIALPRNLEAERAALAGMAYWAYQFGAPVCLCPMRFAVWVEIGQSLKLFGGWKPLALALLADADGALGPRRLAVAPTQSAAYLLACAYPRPRAPVRRVQDLPAALAPLPLEHLPLDEDALALLQGAGLRRIGEVLALPPTSLAERIGPEAQLSLQRLLGQAPELWSRWEPPQHYRRRFDFAEPIEHSEALLFPLKTLLVEFVRYLKARNCAIQQFSLRMVDTRKRVLQHPVGLLAPTQDGERLLRVLREQLERLHITDPLVEVSLEARRFEALAHAQDDLLATGNGGAEAQRLLELRERLIARLGANAVRQLRISPDQRPEAATCTTATTGPSAEASEHPPRPLWLLPAPKPIAQLKLMSPAERIELGWWQGEFAARDYHLAEDAQQRLCWVFRHPEAPERWYLHGFWQ